MASRQDGTDVPHTVAVTAWADAAYEELLRVAKTYNEVITYAKMQEVVYAATGITTGMLMQNWIGSVLEIAAQKAAEFNEPPITSVCVHGDGTIGEGYRRAPKYALASVAADIEVRAAEDRLLCYREYATDLPDGGGVPTLTPQVEIQRREKTDSTWLDKLVAAGKLSVQDRIPFHDHLEVGQLFGRTYKGHQSATMRLDEFSEIWFPKMYPNGDWDNSLSPDGKVMTMRHVPDGKYGEAMQTQQIRKYVITSGHIKPPTGPRYYQFLGVFEGAPHLSNSNRWVHQRVSNAVSFDGTGKFSFEPTSTRSQDDQTAEAADTDLELLTEYQQKLNVGAYAVEDQVGSSKARGSAQAVFARTVKNNYGWACAVTGIKTRAFLVASHIVPWSEDQAIRLDPSNGICLSTFVDRAFDAGYLAITPDGRTSVRWEKVDGDAILKLELSKIDGVELAAPSSDPPDPVKLARRLELGY